MLIPAAITTTPLALVIPPPPQIATAMSAAFVLPPARTITRTPPRLPTTPSPLALLENFNMLQQQQSSEPTMAPFLPDNNDAASSFTLIDPTSVTVPIEKSLRYKLGLPIFGKTVPVGFQQQQGSTTTTLKNNCRIVGHRGAIHEYLENTRESFLKCAEWDIDAIELDVFRLKGDGSLIVFHGAGDDRNPGQLGGYMKDDDVQDKTIMDIQTFEETKSLQFNPDLEEFACSDEAVAMAQIPKLRDVLMDMKQFASPKMEIKIELKGEGVTEPVLALVEELDMVSQCSFSSFDHSKIAHVRDLHPERNTENGEYVYRTGALFDSLPSNFISMAKDVGASEVHVRYDTLSKQVVQDIHNAGMGSMAWLRGPTGMNLDSTQNYLDVDYEEGSKLYSMLMETGVQSLCVNRPNIMMETIKQQEKLQLQREEPLIFAWADNDEQKGNVLPNVPTALASAMQQ